MVIAPVFQWVELCHRTGGIRYISPGVVLIRCNAGGGEGFGAGVVGDLVQAGDVALLVGLVIVGVAVKVRLACRFGAVVHRKRAAGGVVRVVLIVDPAASRFSIENYFSFESLEHRFCRNT